MSRVPDGLSKVERLASALDQALCTGVPIAQWTGAAAITLQEAYAVQALGMAQRCRRGDRKIGLKLAFTNRKAMAHLGVDAPVYGVLSAAIQVPDGGQSNYACFMRVTSHKTFMCNKMCNCLFSVVLTKRPALNA